MRTLILFHVWNDTFRCVTWHIYLRNMLLLVNSRQRLFKCCDMFTRATCLIVQLKTKLQITRTFLYITHLHVCHDSFIRVPWFIHMCAMTQSYVCHDSFICVPWLIHLCAMTHSHVWHDLFLCVPWLIFMCATTHSHVCHDSFPCVPWLIHVCAITQTHSYGCYDSFVYGISNPSIVDSNHHFLRCHDSMRRLTCLIQICATTRLYVCHDSVICLPWLIHICAMNHSRAYHDSFGCVPWSIQMWNKPSWSTQGMLIQVPWLFHMCVSYIYSYMCHESFICMTWLVHVCAMTHSHVCNDSFICAIWLICQPKTMLFQVQWLILIFLCVGYYFFICVP